jgi:hypothetical protein
VTQFAFRYEKNGRAQKGREEKLIMVEEVLPQSDDYINIFS